MTDQQNRPQTLLEAAKAMIDLVPLGEGKWANLRAAIAREEAKQEVHGSTLQWALDRAQQAESTAAWHRAESARLSGELSLARNQLTLAVERSERLSGQLAGCHYDLGEANKKRQRAEKAESDLADQIVQSARWRAVAEKAEAELAERRKEGLASAPWEARAVRAERALLRAGWTDCGGKEWKPPLGPSHPMDGGDIGNITVALNRAGVPRWRTGAAADLTTLDRVDWLIAAWQLLADRIKLAKKNLEVTS